MVEISTEKVIYITDKNGVQMAQLTERDGITNCYVDNRQNGESTLAFKFPVSSPKYQYVSFPEARFFADGREYVHIKPDDSISEQRGQDNSTVCEVNLVESFYLLKKRFITATNTTIGFDHIDKNMVVLVSGGTEPLVIDGVEITNPYTRGSAAYVLYALLYGSEWSVDAVDVEGTFDLETDKKTVYENIMAVVDLWGGILVWDSVARTVSLRGEGSYQPDSGFTIAYQRNEKTVMRRISNDLITRLYVYGKDNLNIASVNGGKEYIDKFDYTSTVYEGMLVNSDIDNPAALLLWGQQQIEKLHKPRITLSFQFVDNIAGDSFTVNDFVTVDDIMFGIKYTARVISKRYSFFHPYDCSADVGDPQERYQVKMKTAIDSSTTLKNLVSRFGKVSTDNITLSGTNQTLTSSLEQTDAAITASFEVIGVDGFTRTGKTEFTVDGITVYGGGIRIKNNSLVNVFYGDSSGNLYLTAYIYAAGGTVGGFSLSSNALTAGSGSTAVGISTGTYAFWAGSSTSSVAPFCVTNTGALYASNANISGTINATSGSFSGTITGGTINAAVSYLGTVYADKLVTSGGSALSYLSQIVANLGTINAGTLTGSAQLDGVHCENIEIEVGRGNGLTFTYYGSRYAYLAHNGSQTTLQSNNPLYLVSASSVIIGNPVASVNVYIAGTLNVNSVVSSGVSGKTVTFVLSGRTFVFNNGILVNTA